MLVKYSRAFPIAPYGINEHIGFEEEIDYKIDPVEHINFLRNLAETAFKQKYPNLVLSNEPIVEKVLSKEQITENTIAEINNCQSLRELLTFQTFAKKHSKETFDAYNEKLKTFK
jgi:hypothetical protein